MTITSFDVYILDKNSSFELKSYDMEWIIEFCYELFNL